MVEAVEVMLHLSFQLVLVLQDVFQAVVLLDWVFLLYDLEQAILLGDHSFDLLGLEVLVELPLEQVPSQFLGVFLEFVLVFLDFSHQGEERVVILLFIEFLGEEGDDIDVGPVLDLNNDVEYLLFLSRSEGNPDGVHWEKEFPDPIIDGGKSQLLALEGLHRGWLTCRMGSSELMISLFSTSCNFLVLM